MHARVRPFALRGLDDGFRRLGIQDDPETDRYLKAHLDSHAFLVYDLSSVELQHLLGLARLSEVFARQIPTPTPGAALLVVATRNHLDSFVAHVSAVEGALGEKLRSMLEKPPIPSALRLPRQVLSLTARPLILGILNVTPDSFFDGGRYVVRERAIARAEEMVEQGADVIDIGGESSRPGAAPTDEDEELRRVLPVVEALCGRLSLPVSVDTTKGSVALRAIDVGAQIVNDISGLRHDPEMARVVAEHGVGVVLMHMRGEPRTMQQNTHYASLLGEILDVLQDSRDAAIRAGVHPDRIIVDPGIGFGKTAQANLVILRELETLNGLGSPILVGASRKSFLQNLFGWKPEDRLMGSVGVATAAVMAGAHMVRVHDVAETRRAIDTVWAIRQAGTGDALLDEGMNHVRQPAFQHTAE